MPFKIITVPFDREKACFLEEELSKFCLNKTIRFYKPEFFQDGRGAGRVKRGVSWNNNAQNLRAANRNNNSPSNRNNNLGFRPVSTGAFSRIS